MPGFFLAFLIAALVTLSSREAVRAARLAQALGGSGGIVLAGLAAAGAVAALTAWLAGSLAPALTPAAKQLLTALALFSAGAELLLLRAGPAPREPTRSAGAMALVLLAGLGTGAFGFLVLALSLATGDPLFAAAGGAGGAGAAMGAAALAAERWENLPLAKIRGLVAGTVILAGAVIALIALNIL